jgi:hypothetical protein
LGFEFEGPVMETEEGIIVLGEVAEVGKLERKENGGVRGNRQTPREWG